MALRARMAAQGLDAVISTTPENICYLTGFDSPGHYWFQALVVPLKGEPFTVSRLLEQSGVAALTWLEPDHNLAYQDADDPMENLSRALRHFGLEDKHLGYEKDCWFFTIVQQEGLFAKCPRTSFTDCSGMIAKGRVIKSDEEVALIRRAASYAAAAMRAGVEAVAPDVTENDIAAEVNYALIKAGSDWPAIVPFIASGERGAIGHATWSGRKISPGDGVFLEIGGCKHRYHAAMMRTCIVGEPDAETLEAFEVVQGAFRAAIAAIKPGVPAGEVDRVARDYISHSAFGGTQASRTAYSIGISLPPDWGEGQILSMKPGETRPLEANMTFHLLPWVQIPGKIGVGCSETVHVTETGCELLTDFPRELFGHSAHKPLGHHEPFGDSNSTNSKGPFTPL
jgi:Xaa-Pro dipeptidase